MKARPLTIVGIAAVVVALVLMFAFDRGQIGQLTLGLGSGALIAALGLGIVLTYKGSGVVNFHNGALAVFVAYIFHGLRGRFDNGDGELYLPPLPNPLALVEGVWNSFVTRREDWIDLWDIPTRIDIDFGDGRMPFMTSLVAALVYAAILGVIFHLLIFRPLRNAPQLAKVVASIGLFLLIIQIIGLRFGGTFQSVVEPNLGTDVYRPIGGNDVVVQQKQLVAAIIVLVAMALLIALFRLTRFGLATRAAAENEKGAVVLGFSPDFLAGANWVLSSTLAGAFGIAVSSITGLDPINLPFLIIPALGAALLGGFNSFAATALGGLGIGMLQALSTDYTSKSWFPREWIPQAGVAKALPFFIVIVVLFVRGKSLPTRGSVLAGKLPAAPRTKNVLRPTLFCVIAILLITFFTGFDWRQAAVNTMIGTALALSVVVITGYVGQISLGQAALGGVAGFALAKWFQDGTTVAGIDIPKIPFPLGPILAALIAAGFGLLVAIPALRVRGVNLAIVTMAAALAIEELVFRNLKLAGSSGVLPVDAPRLFGRDLGPNNVDLKIVGLKARVDGGVPPQAWWLIVCLVVVTLLALMVANVRRSATGRMFLAVRSNERAAASSGVNVSATKLTAFGLSAFIAGIGGVLSGYRFQGVAPSNFGVLASVTLLAFAYLGGVGTISGAVAAGMIGTNALVFTFLDRYSGVDQSFTLYLGALGLILTAVLNPEGIAGGFRLAIEDARHKRAAKQRSIKAKVGR